MASEHMDTITRIVFPSGLRGLGYSHGPMGWIAAAEKHAELFGDFETQDECVVEVFDGNDQSRPFGMFKVRRSFKFTVTNPRQGAN